MNLSDRGIECMGKALSNWSERLVILAIRSGKCCGVNMLDILIVKVR